MTDKLLAIIKEKYPLVPLGAGEFANIKANGMNFTVLSYRAEGLGHVSVMRASGFFGLMKMDTLIVNPTDVDIPLYSYDRIFALGNDTLIVELYDTLAGKYSDSSVNMIKRQYTDLTERDPGEHWYDPIKLSSSISKKGKKKDRERLDGLTLEHFATYLNSGAGESFEKKIKAEKAAYYVNGLLERGGPSTDVFKKELGEEKTSKLFREVLFGTK